MVFVQLDPRGRLLAFKRVPPQRDPSEGPFPDPDWTILLKEAKLDPADTHSARPIWHPLIDCDTRTAWDWTDPQHQGEIIRYEAGAYHGQPVWFEWWAPWDSPFMMEEYRPTMSEKAGQYLITAILVVVLFGGALLARRNLRLGRGDKRGALKLAAFVFSLWMVRWLASTSHIPRANEEGELFLGGLGTALFFATLLAVLYIALEPLARKMWPQILISWSRLLAGGLRDPLVGRDLIVGCMVGTSLRLLDPLGRAVNRLAGYPPPQPSTAMGGLLGLRDAADSIAGHLFFGGMIMLVTLFLLVLFRMLLRKPWAAAAVLLVVYAGLNLPRSAGVFYPSSLIGIVAAAVFLTVLVRFGLLAALVGNVVNFVLWIPIPSNLSAWYAGPALFAIVVVAAVATYGFHCALGGRSAFESVLARE